LQQRCHLSARAAERRRRLSRATPPSLLYPWTRRHRAARRRAFHVERVRAGGGDELAELFDATCLDRLGRFSSAFSSAS
jgi:hypothetical protein